MALCAAARTYTAGLAWSCAEGARAEGARREMHVHLAWWGRAHGRCSNVGLGHGGAGLHVVGSGPRNERALSCVILRGAVLDAACLISIKGSDYVLCG